MKIRENILKLAFLPAHALVLKIVWGWFVVGKFNAPTLNYLEAFGVVLVVDAMMLGQTVSRAHQAALVRAQQNGDDTSTVSVIVSAGVFLILIPYLLIVSGLVHLCQ